MSKEQQTDFLLANLGPEISRYLSFKIKKDLLQQNLAEKRLSEIIYKILDIGVISWAGIKELTMFCEKAIIGNEPVSLEDVNKFFYPFIIRTQT